MHPKSPVRSRTESGSSPLEMLNPSPRNFSKGECLAKRSNKICVPFLEVAKKQISRTRHVFFYSVSPGPSVSLDPRFCGGLDWFGDWSPGSCRGYLEIAKLRSLFAVTVVVFWGKVHGKTKRRTQKAAATDDPDICMGSPSLTTEEVFRDMRLFKLSALRS